MAGGCGSGEIRPPSPSTATGDFFLSCDDSWLLFCGTGLGVRENLGLDSRSRFLAVAPSFLSSSLWLPDDRLELLPLLLSLSLSLELLFELPDLLLLLFLSLSLSDLDDFLGLLLSLVDFLRLLLLDEEE